MTGLFHFFSSQSGLGLAIVRIVAGGILLKAGLGKVMGGYAVGFFTNVGIPLPMIAGPFVSLLEVIGGGALILGLFVRPLGGLFALQFIVATWVVASGRGLWGAQWEVLMIAVGLLLLTNGGGALALDALWGRRSQA